MNLFFIWLDVNFKKSKDKSILQSNMFFWQSFAMPGNCAIYDTFLWQSDHVLFFLSIFCIFQNLTDAALQENSKTTLFFFFLSSIILVFTFPFLFFFELSF